MFIDAHNHLQDPRFGRDLPAVMQAMQDQGIEHCIVNGTSENDWDQVLELHASLPTFVRPAFGLHPWKIRTRSSDWFERLRNFVEQPAASIGECGLDLWIQGADLAEQTAVFLQHIALSRATGKPLTIHCLRAWPELLSVLEAAPALPEFLLHSFGGPPHLIKALIRKGAHFSFSGYFLHPHKTKALKHFQLIPAERLHAETDAPDMAPPLALQGAFSHPNYHHPADLPHTVAALADLRGVAFHEFAAQCRENSRRLFSLP